MRIAAKIGQPRDSWKALAPLLSQDWGYGQVHDLLEDFRNHHEHGHPRE